MRYSITFEVTLMIFLTTAGAVFFEKSLSDVGGLGVILSLKALLISLIYNRAFDPLDARHVSSDS